MTTIIDNFITLPTLPTLLLNNVIKKICYSNKL